MKIFLSAPMVTLLSVLGASAAAGDSDISDMLPKEVVVEKKAPASPWTLGGDVFKRTSDGQELHVVIRKPEGWKAGDRRPGYLFFFAGGFYRIFVNPDDPIHKPLLESGAVCLFPEYRLTANGIKVEDCLADVRSAIRWTREHAAALGIDTNRLIAAGESAGGFLAATSAMVDGHDNPDDDTSVSGKPNALYLVKPVMDISDGRGKRYQGASRTAGQISPVHHVASNAVPTYIVQGSADGFLSSTQLFKQRYDELVQKNDGQVPYPLHFDVIQDMTHTSRPDAFYLALSNNAVRLLKDAGLLTPAP